MYRYSKNIGFDLFLFRIYDTLNLLTPPTITLSQYDSTNNLNRSVHNLNMI